jgi:hypothetical protein
MHAHLIPNKKPPVETPKQYKKAHRAAALASSPVPAPMSSTATLPPPCAAARSRAFATSVLC